MVRNVEHTSATRCVLSVMVLLLQSLSNNFSAFWACYIRGGGRKWTFFFRGGGDRRQKKNQTFCENFGFDFILLRAWFTKIGCFLLQQGQDHRPEPTQPTKPCAQATVFRSSVFRVPKKLELLPHGSLQTTPPQALLPSLPLNITLVSDPTAADSPTRHRPHF